METAFKVVESLPQIFSAASLQDYTDCRRRFQLRYLLHLAWPAIESDPVLENERYIQRGTAYHRMIHQYQLGLTSDQVSGQVEDTDLSRWWKHFIDSTKSGSLSNLANDQFTSYPEIVLSAPLSSVRLLARYDLVQIGPDGHVIIYDWKTSQRYPARNRLANRLQTRIYPYLFVKAGSYLNQGRPIRADAVEMVYWFAEFPERPERFIYNNAQFEADEQYLIRLIDEISHLSGDEFGLTNQIERCRFCVYRSLCERGIEAGLMTERDLDADFDEIENIQIDLDNIVGITF
jgi:hypothetical protein